MAGLLSRLESMAAVTLQNHGHDQAANAKARSIGVGLTLAQQEVRQTIADVAELRRQVFACPEPGKALAMASLDAVLLLLDAR